MQESLKTLGSEYTNLNQDIDNFINTFNIMEDIENNIKTTEQNIDIIFKTINTLGRKVAELKKQRRSPKK